jgi:hypothetical protein
MAEGLLGEMLRDENKQPEDAAAIGSLPVTK